MNHKESSYFGRRAHIATMHNKESVVEPIFQELLGIQVVRAEVDTDQFGTFSGDVARKLSPLETAIAKARAGLELTGNSLGIASEGTIGPHPLLPIASSDLELMVFIDTDLDLVISESVRSDEIVTAQKVFLPGDDLESFLSRADFPNHGLIVRSGSSASGRIIKGLTDRVELAAAIKELAEEGSVVLETDLRAAFSPSRMRIIAQCARLLANRISSHCPSCKAPGWGKIQPLFGVPCRDCGQRVETVVRADQLGCVKCEHVLVYEKTQSSAEARFCTFCNP